MQSHQEIKANPLDYLPAEMLLAIAGNLRPEEAVRFFSTSAGFSKLAGGLHLLKLTKNIIKS